MKRRGKSQSVGSDERAQSVFDFTIGVSLFLVVVTAVFVFVPTAFGAVDDSGVTYDDGLAAERAVDYLAGTAFQNGTTRSARPATFDVTCVVAFFNDTGDCGFERDNDLATDAGLPPGRPLNVTVEPRAGNGTHLCWDADTGTVVKTGSSNCTPATEADVPLHDGSTASGEAFASATRYGRLANRSVYVVVRTW